MDFFTRISQGGISGLKDALVAIPYFYLNVIKSEVLYLPTFLLKLEFFHPGFWLRLLIVYTRVSFVLALFNNLPFWWALLLLIPVWRYSAILIYVTVEWIVDSGSNVAEKITNGMAILLFVVPFVLLFFVGDSFRGFIYKAMFVILSGLVFVVMCYRYGDQLKDWIDRHTIFVLGGFLFRNPFNYSKARTEEESTSRSQQQRKQYSGSQNRQEQSGYRHTNREYSQREKSYQEKSYQEKSYEEQYQQQQRSRQQEAENEKKKWLKKIHEMYDLPFPCRERFERSVLTKKRNRLMRKYHPDKATSPQQRDEFSEMFMLVNSGYDELVKLYC